MELAALFRVPGDRQAFVELPLGIPRNRPGQRQGRSRSRSRVQKPPSGPVVIHFPPPYFLLGALLRNRDRAHSLVDSFENVFGQFLAHRTHIVRNLLRARRSDDR